MFVSVCVYVSAYMAVSVLPTCLSESLHTCLCISKEIQSLCHSEPCVCDLKSFGETRALKLIMVWVWNVPTGSHVRTLGP